MPVSPERLQRIRHFPELIEYLRDELDWPTEDYEFEDLTFGYEPAELGLKDEDAVKVKSIHQLRPLHHAQPWGIFFVEFGKKRLPVVALRRVLRHLVLKNRASANKAERPAWLAKDLLFISATGEGADRELTFAHFVDHKETGLAELRVLGWDSDDTPLKMDYVAKTLSEKLRWRAEYESDPEAWRRNWSDAFTLRHGHVIRTSLELAGALAELAKNLRNRIRTILRLEDGFGEIRKLQQAFQTGLIHDLDDDGFADMFAQTVTYGLFSVSIRRTFPGEGTAVTKDDVPNLIFTSPFLKEMLGVFLGIKSRKGAIDFDELGVSDVTDLLTSEDTHMEAVLRDFNNKTRGEDPVIHFYEHFLSAYNKRLKVQRGVFYTPQPVVSYIVRSVHELLQTEFGLADGLADTTTWGEMVKRQAVIKLPPLTDEPGEKRTISPDEPFVQILDPATGTATFLVEVIDLIHRTLVAKWNQQRLTEAQQSSAWNEYVPQHLLSRVHAFELMMAPYAIAHMKVGLKLAETGYRFGTEERARIYLTNALEPKVKQLPQLGFEALAHEAAAVNEIKWYKRFTVVLGNPPYAVSTQNRGAWALSLIESYKEGLNEKKHTLDDDYVKFAAFSQRCIDDSGVGVWGFITNHGFLKNPTFRGMRHSLIQSFSGLRVYDLHGNLRQKDQQVATGTDENVFDIQQGVAITLGLKKAGPTDKPEAWFTDLWGSRGEKYRVLSGSSVRESLWNQLGPCAPFFLLVPQDAAIREEYVRWPGLTEMFVCYGSGIKTDRDELCLDSVKSELAERMTILFSGKYDDEFIERFNVKPSSSYNVVELARRTRFEEADITRCLYRPFDIRWLYYKRGFTSRPAYEVMQHMLPGENLGLLSARTNKSGKMDHFLCTRLPTEVKVAESTTQSCVFPLYLSDDSEGLGLSGQRAHNFAPSFLKKVAETLTIPQRGEGGLPLGLTPEVIFHYAYAVFHSPGYRGRYAEFLKIDFPRLPLSGNPELFRGLAGLGGELTALHLLESSKLAQPISEFIGNSKEVTKVGYSSGTVWINATGSRGSTIVGTSGFRGVPEAVWNFHIGGYQVCEKWLKDRRGRALSKEDVAHYQKIVIALSETIRLMTEIDALIERHGGWPGAFAGSRAATPARSTLPGQAELAIPKPQDDLPFA